MQKIGLIIGLSLVSTHCWGDFIEAAEHFVKPDQQLASAQALKKGQLPFSASLVMLRAPKAVQEAQELTKEELLLATGKELWQHVGEAEQMSLGHYLKAKQALTLGQSQKALQSAEQIAKTSKLYSEALLMKGMLLAFRKEADYQAVSVLYKQCQQTAKQLERQYRGKNEIIEAYFYQLQALCITHQARLAYTFGQYQVAIELYDQIAPKHKQWPSTLLEKAWAYYKMNNYNRSLGLLATYNAPILKAYGSPEDTMLTGLNYLRPCLWEDGLELAHRYYAWLSERFKVNELSTGKLTNKEAESREQLIAKQIGLKDYYQVKGSSTFGAQRRQALIRGIKHELKAIEIFQHGTPGERKLLAFLTPKLEILKNQYIAELNRFVRTEFSHYLQQVSQMKQELLNLELYVLSQKKDLIYKRQQLIDNRGRGDIGVLSWTSKQYFWTFKEEFWADELGDYTFALKSNCSLVPENKEHS